MSGDESESGYPHSSKFLALGNDKSRVAFRIPRGKRLDNTVNLLRLAGKTDVHQELPQGDVQRIGRKVELGKIIIESTDIECVSAEENLAR